MPIVVEGRVRFVLSDIKEDEIRFEGGYYHFGPTVSLEIDGRNVFRKFGSSGARYVMIMPSLEGTLVEAKRMAKLYPHELSIPPKQEYSIWFEATGVGFELKREGDELNIVLEVDPSFGGVGNLKCGSYPVARVTVREWVEGVVTLAKDLHDMFRRLNPETYADLGDQKSQISELESWLESQNS